MKYLYPLGFLLLVSCTSSATLPGTRAGVNKQQPAKKVGKNKKLARLPSGPPSRPYRGPKIGPAPSDEPYGVKTLISELSQVGDNSFNPGSNGDCMFPMQTHARLGADWSSQFTVVAPSTTVNIVVEGVCGIGVKANEKSYLAVLDNAGEELTRIYFKRHTPRMAINNLTLFSGIYRVRIRSYRYPSGDHDDFDIGSLKLNYQKGAISFPNLVR